MNRPVIASRPEVTRWRDAFVAAFLVPPKSALEWIADAVRVLGLLSLVVAAAGWGALAGSVLALALIGAVVPRFLGLRAGVDLAVSLISLIAAWCSVLGLYRSVTWIDIPIHFALNGLLALIVIVVADRLGVLFDRRRIPLFALVFSTGLALAAIWEVGEWTAHRFDEDVYVGYDDSIGDMVMGGSGSLVAALLFPFALARGRWPGAVRGQEDTGAL